MRASIEERRWRDALLRELDHEASLTTGRRLTSIFFGGGTPSLMAADTVGRIIERAAAHWAVASDIEITLEANPNSAEAARFRDYRAAGIDRLSIGVQALDDAALSFLGRLHGSAEALAALSMARDIFPRYSFDLIYARPGQTRTDWTRELERALQFAGGHMSLYQLTIEEGTSFHAKAARGDFAPLGSDDAADLFELTQDMMETAGLPAYEISNHAAAGHESRHNLVYWRYGEYAGIGPGAHGRLILDSANFGRKKTALRKLREPEAWLAAVEGSGDATCESEPLATADIASEMMMMGLRLREGVCANRFERETGMALEDFLDATALEDLAAAGFIARDDAGIRATASGRIRLNAVLARLLA